MILGRWWGAPAFLLKTKPRMKSPKKFSLAFFFFLLVEGMSIYPLSAMKLGLAEGCSDGWIPELSPIGTQDLWSPARVTTGFLVMSHNDGSHWDLQCLCMSLYGLTQCCLMEEVYFFLPPGLFFALKLLSGMRTWKVKSFWLVSTQLSWARANFKGGKNHFKEKWKVPWPPLRGSEYLCQCNISVFLF